MWSRTSIGERGQLINAIKRVDLETVRGWFDQNEGGLESLPKIDLLDMARKLRIKNYSRLPKAQLIKALRGEGVDDKTCKRGR